MNKITAFTLTRLRLQTELTTSAISVCSSSHNNNKLPLYFVTQRLKYEKTLSFFQSVCLLALVY